MVIKRDILDELGTMGLNDLIELNHLVVGMIKHKRAHEAFGLSLKFKVGNKVSFSSKRDGYQVGEIVKVNRTKAVVAVKGAYGASSVMGVATVKWSVPFSILTKVRT